ncbi:hypothetical protein TNCV_652421 [Trichonephila clavipes]|nr:hypothetical protein TNCV_652421 [Trichonephila clavipes]
MGIILYLMRVFLSGVSYSVWAEIALKMASVRSPCHCFNSGTSDQNQENVREDRRMSIRMIVEAVNADKETVRKNLHEELHMTRICSKLVLKILTPDS